MAEPPLHSAADADIGTPRWVKVFGIAVFVAFLLFFIVVGAVHHMAAGRHSAAMPADDRHSGRTAAQMPGETQEDGR